MTSMDFFGDEPATSLQSLGDARVLVDFESDGFQAYIVGALVNGESVPADVFAPHILREWKRLIEKELEQDRADIMAGQADWVEA